MGKAWTARAEPPNSDPGTRDRRVEVALKMHVPPNPAGKDSATRL